MNTFCTSGGWLELRSLVQFRNTLALSTSVLRETLSNLGFAPFFPKRKHLEIGAIEISRLCWHICITKSVSCFFLTLPSSEVDSGTLWIMTFSRLLAFSFSSFK